MADSSSHLLALATATSSQFNLQIPPIKITLESENYCLWSITVTSALETFDLESHILAPNPPPETCALIDAAGVVTHEPNPDFLTWKCRDRFVLLWLKSTLSERALTIVSHSNSAYAAWSVLSHTFQAQTRARRMSMKLQLQNLSKGSMSVMEYVEHKRSIADSLATTLHPVADEDLIGYILFGLDSSYASFSTAFTRGGLGAKICDSRSNVSSALVTVVLHKH